MIRKVDTPRGGPRQIVQTVIETDTLPGGTITSRQTQTIDFATDQSESIETTATFTGTVIGGTGQYANARGTISGGGRGVNGVADWRVAIDLR